MPPIPLQRPRDVVKALEKRGWQVASRKHSHNILTKTGDIATLSIPDHPQVAHGTLRYLFYCAGLTAEEFLKAIGE